MTTLDADFVRPFAERWLAAWNTRDPDNVLELCTEDVTWADPALAERIQGKDAVRSFLTDTWGCFPDLEFTAPDPPFVDVERGKAAQFWALEGTMLGPAMPTGFAPTGARVTGRGVDIYEFRDGLVSHYQAVYDLGDWLRQMGMLPERGSRGERIGVVLQRLGAGRQRKRNARERERSAV